VKKKKELLAEYEKVRLFEAKSDLCEFERICNMRTLQWVIWGTTVDSPSEALAMANQATEAEKSRR